MSKNQQPIDPSHLEILRKIPEAPICGHWPHAGVDEQIARLSSEVAALKDENARLVEARRIDALYAGALQTERTKTLRAALAASRSADAGREGEGAD